MAMRILVVDDDRAVRDSLRRSLEFNGYQVELASDGAQALEAIVANRRNAFALLELCLSDPKHVLTRSRILEEVWGYDFPTSGNALEVYVGYLRRKTEAPGEPRLIHTVRGVGYVLRETPP